MKRTKHEAPVKFSSPC